MGGKKTPNGSFDPLPHTASHLVFDVSHSFPCVIHVNIYRRQSVTVGERPKAMFCAQLRSGFHYSRMSACL
uniref:Uncharacterized protein n=1 Tax=Paramormyrops kingsleyae TaxID=1676925 RepID=A0A3B3RZJ6_9TELE